MVFISSTAQEYFAKLLTNQKNGTQIRIFVDKPGTFNAKIGISYCLPNKTKMTDIVMKFKQLTVYVDKISAQYLEDAEINFVTNNLDFPQLIIKAPNLKRNKMSDNSCTSLAERVKYMLESQINPQLANHGGQVSLMEITKDNFVIIKFSGGCNGCSMVRFTLKEGIEKKLLNEFPELNGVKDFTEHKHSEYSYY